MNRFHPAKPVSVYNTMNRNTFISFLRQEFLQTVRKKVEEHHKKFNWQSYVPYPFNEIYDASMKGLNSYLEISDGKMIVHVEPEKLK